MVKRCHQKDIIMIEDHYKKIIEFAPLGYIHCKIQKDEENHFSHCIILEANKAFEKLTQLSNDQIIGRTIRDVLPGIEKNGVDCFSIFQEPSTKNLNLEKEFKVGDRCFRINIQFESSEFCNLLFTDLTKHKQALAELEESKQQFEVAINGTNDGIWDWNLLTNSLFLSKRWKNMLGYQENELPNQFDAFMNLIVKKDRKRVEKYVQKYLQGDIEKYSIEFQMTHKDGSLRWILAKGAALRTPDGKPYRMAGSQSDITERKEGQKAIAEKKAYIESLLNAIPDMVFVLDQNGMFVDLKSGQSKSLYLPREIFIGKLVSDVLPNNVAEPIMKSFSKVLNGELSEPIQYKLSIDEEIRDFEARLTLANNQRVIGMVRDITSVKEIEA